MQEKLPVLAQASQSLPEFVDEFTFGLQTWLNCVIEGPLYLNKTVEAVNAGSVSNAAYDELHRACVRVTAAFRESVAAAHGLANPKPDAPHRILVPRSDTGEMPTYGDGVTDDTQNKQRILNGLEQLSQQLPEYTLSAKGQKRERSQDTPGTNLRQRQRRVMPPSPGELPPGVLPQPDPSKKRGAPEDAGGDGSDGDSKRTKPSAWEWLRGVVAQRAAFGMVNLLEHLF